MEIPDTAKGKIKKLFPGNNTSEGFYSFYHYINPNAVRTYLLKGGPGTGKSSLMKKTGALMLGKGLAVEYHYCSSDHESLDGVAFPEIGVAIIDGTTPHLVDPQYPGAVDEIVYLGEFWDKRLLHRERERIMVLTKLKARMFQSAYSNLKEARVAQEEMEGYYREAINGTEFNQTLYATMTEVLKMVSPQDKNKAKLRRFFAGANTPAGYIHFLDSILAMVETLYLLTGEPVDHKELFLDAVYQRGSNLGLACEVYHCSLIPTRPELVCFPELHTAILRFNPSLKFNFQDLPCLKKHFEINFDRFLDPRVWQIYRHEIADARGRVDSLRQKAWDKLKKAKSFHEELEKIYVKAVDFIQVNQKGEEIIAEILAIAKSLQ